MTSTELAQLLGVGHWQISEWCKGGYLQPEGGGTKGRPRHFPPAEVDVALRLVRLIDAGLTAPAAAQVARGEGDLGGGILVLVLTPEGVVS